jgi:hypothetical protein
VSLEFGKVLDTSSGKRFRARFGLVSWRMLTGIIKCRAAGGKRAESPNRPCPKREKGLSKISKLLNCQTLQGHTLFTLFPGRADRLRDAFPAFRRDDGLGCHLAVMGFVPVRASKTTEFLPLGNE